MTTKGLTSVRTTQCKNPLIPGHLSWKVDQAKERIVKHLESRLAREPGSATVHDWFLADAYALRDRILERFIKTQEAQHTANCRRVYYMCMEYLMGRLLRDNLNNCQMFDLNEKALRELGLKFDAIEAQESDMGLGNGGLGRLAACIMDSLSALNYPAVGYGIHYEFGMFRQEFVHFRQKELADNWLLRGNPWQINRPENMQTIPIYGHVEDIVDASGNPRKKWVGYTTLRGIPWDIPVVGYGAQTVNFLRLWEAKASDEFDLNQFNAGNFLEAVEKKAESETISRVLYPNDSSDSGKKLRLVQQYFFAACSLRDIIRRHFNGNNTWDNFSEKVCIQLNDTHPTIAVVELMRILIDENGIPWEKAWNITSNVFNYTNHTLLPEALEKWSVPLFEFVLPYHLHIIYEINEHFIKTVAQKHHLNDTEKIKALSIIEEGPTKFVRMANLAVIGSESVNGVAAMHSELVKSSLFPDFAKLFPKKFKNVTNGITPRRWINSANPRLAELLNKTIGPEWIIDLSHLRKLEPYANDLAFRNEFARIKLQNKNSLAAYIKIRCGVDVSPEAIFDSQVKRIHEYKRQHLKLLHVLSLYHRLLNDPKLEFPPRVFIFAGKAAPGYFMAKTIIHAINLVAHHINNDPRIGDRIKVVFIPNYDVSSAMKIIPATDLSEQISTAGTEASGTGNMKFAMNGALTIGTLDGANVEILEQVGDGNIFIFGHTADQLNQLRPTYNPHDFYQKDDELKYILDWMQSELFEQDDGFNPVRRIAETLLNDGDRFFVLADYRKYIAAQDLVSEAYLNQELWYSMAILNVARMDKFSSDRTVKEYADKIWRLNDIKID
ncbi:MAG: glycogen/starch/alpha-glucan phosphorylase [Puniceicoccales bacterium]|jgi:starch phosphorylase|nr:glycogen/starch/alpha-glucan phosphorylase [Puniceicoccales bacterium]